MSSDVPTEERCPGAVAVTEAAPETAAEPPETVIEAGSDRGLIDLAEVWKYRDLLYTLAWRDIKARYKQTVLGAAWAVLQPLLLMVIFTLVLGRMVGVSTRPIPYPLFVYAGLLPWTFFATAISNTANCFVNSENLITKVYFPRLVIPIATVAAALVDFAIAFVVLLVLMAAYGIGPTWNVLLLPGLVVLLAVAALGVGTLLASLNVAYRDLRYALPFLIQLWLFATPSIYLDTTAKPAELPAAAAAEAGPGGTDEEAGSGLGRVLDFNPMTGLIASFRVALLGGRVPWVPLGVSTLLAVLLLGAGCYVLRRCEDSFADII